MSLFNDLPVAFPWYDKLEKQNRYKPHTEQVVDFRLSTPFDAMLPFEFRRPKATFPPVLWEIYEINSNTLVADITRSILPYLRAATANDYDYFYYAGETLVIFDATLELPQGAFYYSKITMSDGSTYYSEMFHVPCPGFSVAGNEAPNLLKLVWWNNSDIPPIYYNDKNGGGIPYFRNVLYLDTFIHVSEPEIQEETTNDGYDRPIPTFQRAIIRYRITDMVPDFLKVALVLIQMHDNVIITTSDRLFSGPLQNLTTTSQAEEGGAVSVVEILFEEHVAFIKKSCPDNMALLDVPLPGEPTLYFVHQQDINTANVSAAIFPGYWGILYGSVNPTGGPWVQIGQALQYGPLNAGTATVPFAEISAGNYDWFRLDIVNFNFPGGFYSNTVPLT